jgi:tetratricopeptide (TPR) repeat protein
MKKLYILTVLLLLAVSPLFGDFNDILARADDLHDQEAYAQGKQFLESSLSQAGSWEERAELYWRLARAVLNLGDEAEDAGATEEELLGLFEEGEALADKAIEADPGNDLGYYWKSANIGRWGQTKGILNSLFKAKPMKELLEKTLDLNAEHADSYYVLGQLYEQLPGKPISFGKKDYAVSLGRLAVDLHEAQVKSGQEKEINYDFYTELAKHLYARDWDADKRFKEQRKNSGEPAAGTTPLEKGFVYEANNELKNMSDREEARKLLLWTIGKLESLPGPKSGQTADLEEAREVLESWN